MITPEARALAKRARHQRTWVHMKVRSVGVRRVWDCMLCACVSEEREDDERGEREGEDTQAWPCMFVYYESLKRELKTKTIYGFRCDERLKN